MKLEHLIQGYNFNRIAARIKEETSLDTGIITYMEDENINASYLLDEEGFVNALVLFSNCVIVSHNKTIANQLKHTTDTLLIIQKSIELIGNTNQEEANKILINLGIFNKKIKRKAIKFMNHVYEVDCINAVLKFSITEVEEKSNPPAKISKK